MQKIWIGFGIFIFSLIFPKFIQIQHIGLLSTLNDSISQQDSGLLLIASAKLVLVNSIRHVPIYIGAFIMGEGFYSIFKIHQLGFLSSLIIIPVAYKCISLIYNISFVIGGPSYLTVLVIYILHRVTVRIQPILIKAIIITLFLFGLDWLDILPFLSKYGFGRGELTITIKQVAEFIGANYIMNFVGLFFSITIIINALILSKVVIEYYNKLLLIEESQKKEDRLRRFEVNAVKSRYFKEVKHLVHDLKTPLVTIQGLSEVIQLKIKDEEITEYTDRIISSAEQMSLMISEILYENKMHEINIGELFDFVKMQLSLEEFNYRVKFNIIPDLKIYTNKVRLSRAIINLIENALRATNPENGQIVIKAWKDVDKIKISVKDNGVGISKENINKIWENGYSTSLNNTGLGLNFVKQVIEDHYGQIQIESKVGLGTEARISIPEVD